MENDDIKKQEDESVEQNTDSTSETDKTETPESDKQESKTQAEEIAALKDKYLRLFSDFENYKRRNARERLDLIQTASKDLLMALLPVLDDFDRAQKSMDQASDNNIDQLKTGLELIHNKLFKTLESKGLKKMPSSKGQEFDMELHEAITQFPAPSEDLKNKVVDEVDCGYMLGDKVVRFAKVVVGV
ncbi:MAG: nucleotide exchange factor GrpE [Cytophagales bacterium]|nr:MAG: nucleotide exchange factor GrpE [Cytophagales bacterium]TAF60087.1 MAG: nucleotide exchange factor GrpE [Cytophagales bacterium]